MDSRVHYKDCSRYNWHDPEAQCDGARCHPKPSSQRHGDHVADTPECWDKCGDPATQHAEEVAQMQAAVSGVLDQIEDVNAYVNVLLAHWAWVAKTIDAAVGQGAHRRPVNPFGEAT